MRRLLVLTALSLLLAGCGQAGQEQGPAPASSATPSPTATGPSIAGLTRTLTRIARSQTPSATVGCPGSGDLRSGQSLGCTVSWPSSGSGTQSAALYVSVLDDAGRFVFGTATGYGPQDYPSQERSCRVLSQPPANREDPGEVGLDYAGLLAFWNLAGRPASMDDDGDAIPCETVYPARTVARTLASPLRIEPYPVGAVTLEEVRAYAEAVLNGNGRYQVQGTLICQRPQGADLDTPATPGSTLQCHRDPDLAVQEGGIGLTVLDGTGRFVMTSFPCCGGGPWPEHYPAGSTCAELNAPPTTSDFWDFGLDYGQAFHWWALHGMPRSLDTDGDDRPCEEVYPAAAVDAVLDNTLQPPAA